MKRLYFVFIFEKETKRYRIKLQKITEFSEIVYQYLRALITLSLKKL